MRAIMYLIIFFFQAEDGIRDYKVTGVQTCALPISPRAGAPRFAGAGCPRRARPVRRGGSRLGVLSLPPVQRTAATRRRPLRGHRPASHGVAAPVLRLALPHDRTGGPARCSPGPSLVRPVAGTLFPPRARCSLAVLPGARVLSPAGSHGLVISVGSGLPAEGGARPSGCAAGRGEIGRASCRERV